jgi:hypothetical protein
MCVYSLKLGWDLTRETRVEVLHAYHNITMGKRTTKYLPKTVITAILYILYINILQYYIIINNNILHLFDFRFFTLNVYKWVTMYSFLWNT